MDRWKVVAIIEAIAWPVICLALLMWQTERVGQATLERCITILKRIQRERPTKLTYHDGYTHGLTEAYARAKADVWAEVAAICREHNDALEGAE